MLLVYTAKDVDVVVDALYIYPDIDTKDELRKLR
jgi:hypothetical protein